jgi:hypothetical protein
MDGPNWDDKSGWLSEPVESWKGITITDSRVSGIDLSNNNLTGVLPEELGQLSELRILRLFINNISGEIPAEIGDLSKLEEFSISKNDLTGQVPATLGQLASLRILVLLSNQLTGPLPDLSGLQSIEEFVIGRNDFPGPFPEWTLNLTNLRFLGLGNLGLTGNLPSNILEALPNLDHLRLDNNQLEGDISDWFHGTTPMQTLSLYNNRFFGKMQDNVVDAEIRSVVIAKNDLEGIPDFSGAIEMKSFFLIDENKLGFHELEKVMNVTTFNASNYAISPQKTLLNEETHVVMPGESVIISSGSESDLDSYQWFKNDTEIPNASARRYEISSYTESDAGVYHCVIQHPNFSFDLQRSPITLETEVTSSAKDVLKQKIEIYPNPATDFLSIKGEDVKSVRICNLSGSTIIESNLTDIGVQSLHPGLYLVHIETAFGYISSVFVKS